MVWADHCWQDCLRPRLQRYAMMHKITPRTSDCRSGTAALPQIGLPNIDHRLNRRPRRCIRCPPLSYGFITTITICSESYKPQPKAAPTISQFADACASVNTWLHSALILALSRTMAKRQKFTGLPYQQCRNSHCSITRARKPVETEPRTRYCLEQPPGLGPMNQAVTLAGLAQ